MKKLKLIQLLEDNRRPGPNGGPSLAAKIKLTAEAGSDETVIYLYDPIVSSRAMAEWYGCVCAQDLVPLIDGVRTAKLILRINCPGGDVFAMQAIMNSLRNQKAEKIGRVDGIAASAATGIAMTLDQLIMEPGSMMMIHNSQGLAYGDKHEMRSMAELQDKVDGGMVDAYKEKTGKTAEQLVAWMDAETWFTAEEAVTEGFASSVNSAGKKADARGGWNLSAYANAPLVASPEPAPEPEVTPTQVAIVEPQGIGNEHRERLAQRLRVVAALAPRITSAPLAQ